MSTASKLSGVYPVFHTPFKEDFSIDEVILEKEIQWMYDNGVDGIVMAMVSETLRLASEEREQLAELACRYGKEQGGVIISIGAESTHTAVRYAKHAQDVGADAVMVIPPTSTGASSDQLKQYYEAVIKALKIPVIVQDASGYVGTPMSIAMQAQLFKDFGEQVMYKPEASPIGPKLTELLDATDNQAAVFEGTGGIAMVDSYQRGIVGSMPGADLSWATVELWKALVKDDWDRINAINGPLCSMISLQTSLDAFLVIEKHLMVKQNIFVNTLVRGPLGFELDEKTRQEVDRLFDLLQIRVNG